MLGQPKVDRTHPERDGDCVGEGRKTLSTVITVNPNTKRMMFTPTTQSGLQRVHPAPSGVFFSQGY